MATSKSLELRALAALEDLGFSGIEARIYSHLLAHSPTTGYRVSHAIGKPTANTYKAIVELARRGAVQIDDGDSRLVRAVPVAELLAQMEREARARRRAAEDVLQDLEPSERDDRVYTLGSTRQVLERARAMIERAERIVVADLSPLSFGELHAQLVEAVSRNVLVSVKVYEQPDPNPPAGQRRKKRVDLDLVRAMDPGVVRDAWPGQQLSLVVDAREHLLALLSDDLETVHQAVWSGSTFLSCMHHNHVAVEIEFTRMAAKNRRLPRGATLLLTARPPGLADLQSRYAPNVKSKKTRPDQAVSQSKNGGSR